MKNYVLILTAIFLVSLAQTAYAQPICGFDGVHARMMKTDPEYRKSIAATEASIRKYIAAHKSQLEMKVDGTAAALYTIPVVVHVVHTGGAIGSIYNPTDAQVVGAIDYLNQVYDGTYPGTAGVGDLQIQFVLAQRDPNCNPTNGITRVNGAGIANYVAGGVNSSTSVGTDELNVKNLERWPVSSYYNIWVVNKIDAKDGTSGSFIAGFAYFPSAAPSAALYDGTIMLATQMKTGQKTLPHEIGHAFNLYHPFESPDNGTTCPAYSSTDPTVAQNTGDLVTDTDPITLPPGFICRTGTNNCTVDAGNPAGNPYSTNTESNYMSYTNCYKLFTAGQKARLLASAGGAVRLSLSSSLGGTPTTSASNPCAPKINFEFSDDQQTETTVTTTGCRSYKDYTYNMVIGNDPTAAATATLTIGAGTATEGVDFDITTNGSFSSPSKTLSFAAGSHAAQAFTVRVYDDAIVDPAETCILGFTVNNGGGNAVKGDGRISFTLTINDNDVAPYNIFSSTKSLGGYTTNLQSPFDGANAKTKSEVLFRVAELNAAGIKAGNITGLSMNILKNTAAGFIYKGLTIKMGQVSTAINGFSPVSDASFTTVYSADYSTVNGLNSFTFSTPFAWDGASNVVVVICFDNGSTTSVNDNCQGYDDGATGISYVFSTSINCSGSFGSASAFSAGIKPNFLFVYQDPGTQVQTTLNTSRQEYLGPNTDTYFYDQATGKLMARISNATGFDYGCTQVTIDRNITSAAADAVKFWNNNTANYLLSKTLKVTPATNNPSGSYSISLYYTQAEINAWQIATGQSASNLQVVKVSTQVSDVTPSSPSGGGAVVIVTPTITTVNNNTVLTASFNTGFSGFGAGVAGLALPIRLLDFRGSLKSNSVVLDWSTSSEINSGSFDVERSYDGISFNKVGMIYSAGNSNTTRNYSFADPAIAQEQNYYRLKQIDIDGRFEYSKTVLIANKNFTGNFKILNNPFTDVLDIDFGRLQTGKTDIRLLDVTGKEMYRVTNDASGQTRIRVNLAGRNISAGIYLLQVTTSQQQFIERVMKK